MADQQTVPTFGTPRASAQSARSTVAGPTASGHKRRHDDSPGANQNTPIPRKQRKLKLFQAPETQKTIVKSPSLMAHTGSVAAAVRSSASELELSPSVDNSPTPQHQPQSNVARVPAPAIYIDDDETPENPATITAPIAQPVTQVSQSFSNQHGPILGSTQRKESTDWLLKQITSWGLPRGTKLDWLRLIPEVPHYRGDVDFDLMPMPVSPTPPQPVTDLNSTKHTSDIGNTLLRLERNLELMRYENKLMRYEFELAAWKQVAADSDRAALTLIAVLPDWIYNALDGVAVGISPKAMFDSIPQAVAQAVSK